MFESVEIFWDKDFGGPAYQITRSVADLGEIKFGFLRRRTWANEISALKITGGSWKFYGEPNYVNFFAQLGPGEYPWVGDVGIPNDAVMSIELVSSKV